MVQTDRQTDSPIPLESCCRFTIVRDTGQIEDLLLMRYRQTHRQTDLPEPLEGCSRFTIVGDTGQIEALLLMWYRQTDRQTHLNHLKVAAGLPLLETQVRLRLSCSCGTDRQIDRQKHRQTDRQTDRLT